MLITGAVAREIVAESLARTYSHPETLAFLTLAIDENWTTLQPAVFDAYETVRAGTDASIDPWWMLHDVRAGHANVQSRLTFKNRLYKHIRDAAALYTRITTQGAGPLDALTPKEQHQLLEDVRQIRAQLGPRAHPSWPSLGLNDKGEELTLRDAFGVMKKDVAAIKNKLGT